jgi:hypothetical protein
MDDWQRTHKDVRVRIARVVRNPNSPRRWAATAPDVYLVAEIYDPDKPELLRYPSLNVKQLSFDAAIEAAEQALSLYLEAKEQHHEVLFRVAKPWLLRVVWKNIKNFNKNAKIKRYSRGDHTYVIATWPRGDRLIMPAWLETSVEPSRVLKGNDGNTYHVYER